MKEKVIIALSGGVDSSVAACLLQEQGYDVIGVFMKFWKDGVDGVNRCCSSDSERNARLICNKLKIPFYVFDFQKEFKEKVVNYFLNEYKKGITPNPCVVCNKEIKFGLLLEKALNLGVNMIATGHYALVVKKDNKFKLLKGKDSEKDQSYFLWKLKQTELKRILFPVGSYNKKEVRQLAKKFKLPTAEAKESQEICFVKGKVNDFLKKHLKKTPGQIVNMKKEVIGEHEGLWFYTIGQRKGLKITKITKNEKVRKPFYVVKKDIKKNILIVSQSEKDLYQKQAIVKKINQIQDFSNKPLKVSLKTRYSQKPVLAILNKNKVTFAKPQKAITPGQSIVFYNKNEVLGGGIIT